MQNKDMPAMPTTYMDQVNGCGELYCDNTGLTKLEHFAGLAPTMPNWFEKKFIANLGSGTLDQNKERAFMAWPVYYASALLTQLEADSDE